MSSKTCFMPGCSDLPISGCSCSTQIFICKNHYISHISSSGNHNPKTIESFISINPIKKIRENLKKIQENLKKNLETTNKNISNLLTSTEELVNLIRSNSQKLLKTFLNEKRKIKSYLQSLVITSSINAEISESIFSKEGNHVKSLHFSTDPIKEALKSLFEQDLKENLVNDDEYALLTVEVPEIHLELIDLNTLERKKNNFEIDNLSLYATCCKIYKDCFFFYGGRSKKGRLGLSRIVDFRNRTVKELPQGSLLSSSGGFVYNQHIFVFGGNDGTKAVCNTRVFSLHTSTWSERMPLPQPNDGTSASFIDSSIWVVGFYSAVIYLYNSDKDTYSYLDAKIPSNIHKMLIGNFLTCFGGHLYEISDGNLVIRQSFTDYGGNIITLGYFKRDKYYYFLLNGPKLYRIDTTSKTIERLNLR